MCVKRKGFSSEFPLAENGSYDSFSCYHQHFFPSWRLFSTCYAEVMESKPREERDKEIKELVDRATDQYAHLLWEHWLWLKKKEEEKQNLKKKDN